MASADDTLHFDTSRLNAIDPVAVGRLLDHVVRRGRRYYTRCPWHDERNASLQLGGRDGCAPVHCYGCGRSSDVIGYVMQHESIDFRSACQWLNTQFQADAAQSGPSAAVSDEALRARVAAMEQPLAYVPMHYVDDHLSTANSLSRCVARLYDDATAARVTALYRLGIGAYRDAPDYTLLPLIDEQGCVHNIKRQHYCTDPSSDRFAHCDHDRVYWLSPELISQRVVPAGSRLDTECLFGAHLLPQRPAAVVALVESPKNAVVGAAERPDLLWVAAGNKTALTRQVAESLRGRRVIVFPDRDAIAEWTALVEQMADVAHFTVSSFAETVAPPDDPHYDLADYIVARRLLPF